MGAGPAANQKTVLQIVLKHRLCCTIGFFQVLGEGGQDPGQDAVHIGNGNAVVGHGHVLLPGSLLPIGHFLGVQHAAAAVDHQLDFLEQVREAFAAGEDEFRLGPGEFANPVGHFHGANVVALAVVGAAFRNQHLVPVFQFPQLYGAFNEGAQLALVAGKQDGEGGQGDFWGHHFVDDMEDLAVGDHQFNGAAQGFQEAGEFFRLGNQGGAVAVQEFPDGLLLGQNQPAFGGGAVHRHYQYGQVPGLEQVKNQGALVFRFAGQGGQPFLQLRNMELLLGADGQGHGLQVLGQGKTRGQVNFVEDYDIGNFPSLDFGEQFLVKGIQALGGVHHQEGHIGAAQHQPGFFNPGLAQVAVVVHPRGVREQHGAQGQDFHGFGHRVRGGALKVGNNGQVLAGQGVDQGGLAGVAAAEQANMDAFPGRGFI